MGLITGSNPGQIYYYRRKASGVFSPGEILNDKEGSPLSCGSSLSVTAGDLDGDGDPDLVAGNAAGAVYWIPNEGTRKKPAFGKPVKLMAGDKAVTASGGSAGPCLVDWDDDGLLDLLLGSEQGGVVWCRNVGSKTEAKFASAETIIPPSKRNPGTATSMSNTKDMAGSPASAQIVAANGWRTKVNAVDWNGDGLLDLIVGDCNTGDDKRTHGYVWVYLRKTK